MKKIAVLVLTVFWLTVIAAVPVPAQQRRLVTIASGWVVGVYFPLAGAMSA